MVECRFYPRLEGRPWVGHYKSRDGTLISQTVRYRRSGYDCDRGVGVDVIHHFYQDTFFFVVVLRDTQGINPQIIDPKAVNKLYSIRYRRWETLCQSIVLKEDIPI